MSLHKPFAAAKSYYSEFLDTVAPLHCFCLAIHMEPFLTVHCLLGHVFLRDQHKPTSSRKSFLTFQPEIMLTSLPTIISLNKFCLFLCCA
jgi:hypothetical protein